jgi:hypothetical protein
MDSFRPSDNFTARIMEEVQAYEARISTMEKIGSRLQFSNLALAALTAGGVLLGIFNLIRFASMLISPALCL